MSYRVYHSIDYREETTLSFNYGKILTIRDATPGATFTIETSLGEKLNIPIDVKYLFRVENTRPMKELDKTARKKNVEKAFKIYNY